MTDNIPPEIADDRQLTLSMLIETLRSLPEDSMLRPGIVNPHSYRGFYEQIAFETVSECSVADAIRVAARCPGRVMTGYKGGEYEMGYETLCNISRYGSCSLEDGADKLTMGRLRSMVTTALDVPPESAPAPARISPEVRETILCALSLVLGESMMESYEVYPAIAFVEALP